MTEGYIGGLVSVEDGNPPASGNEFDPRRKVKVEIGFAYDVNAGPDAIKAALDTAGSFATAKVAELLGRKLAARPTEDAPPVVEVKKAARSRKAEAAPPASSEPTGDTAGSGASDPFATESPEIAAQRAALAAELNGAGATDVVEDDPFTVQPEIKEITDADLNAAVQKKNNEINDSPAIRGLIAKYNPDKTKVFQLREITQAQRQDFLDGLAALKKAA